MNKSIYLVDDRDERYDGYYDAEFMGHICPKCGFVKPTWYPRKPPAYYLDLPRPVLIVGLNMDMHVLREDLWKIIKKACPRAVATRCKWTKTSKVKDKPVPYFSVIFPPTHEIQLRGEVISARSCLTCKRRHVVVREKYAYLRPSQQTMQVWTVDNILDYVSDDVAMDIKKLKYSRLKLWEYPVYEKPLPGHSLPSDKLR